MKWNKKQAGLIAGVVCVILLIILLLSMCKGSGNSNEPAAIVESTGSVTETTESAGVSPEATETTTEATEETTEATEESTEPTTGGNTRPGGTAGPGLGGGGNSDDSTATQPATPKAGSEESPYMEVIAQFPDSVNTVAIPAEGTVHYSLSLDDESVDTYGESLLIIAAEDAYVVYNETKYEAEDGVISVPLAALFEESEEDTETGEDDEAGETEQTKERLPVSIQICNIGKEAKTFLLSLDAPLGTVDNPQELQRDENGEFSAEAVLEADDQDGYYFDFEAERDGTLQLQIDSVTENTVCDVIVTAGETSVTLPSDAAEPKVTMDFKKGDMVTVQVIAKAAEDGTIPASEIKLSGSADYYGSKTNPIVVDKDFTTEEMEPGLVLYYLVENQNGMALNVEEPAYVIYNGKTYQAPEPEDTETDDSEDSSDTAETEEEPYIVSVKIGNSDTAALMAIGNGGEENAAFAVTFGYPAGHVENKAPLSILDTENQIDGVNTAVVEDGDSEVYWFTWTNDKDTGILTITLPDSGNWKYQIQHTSGSNKTQYDMQYSDSEDAKHTVELVVDYEDVVDIRVCTYDPANQNAMPVGSVSFEASFLPHTMIAAEGDTWLTVDGRSMIYCKQGLKYADGAIMTVVAVEADADGNAVLDEAGNVKVLTDRAYTIDYEGDVYTSENGTIVIEGIEMESTDPDIFTFLNDSEEKTTYRISFSYPEGHMANPIALKLDTYSVSLYGDGKGIFYTWTTAKPGTFRFEMTSGEAWTYNITTTKDAATYASTKSLVNQDAEPVVSIVINQNDIDAAENGEVTISINVGNPSTDPENRVDVAFQTGFYHVQITQDSQLNVAAGQSITVLQQLEDKTHDGMQITGADSFAVTYNGKAFLSQNGVVKIDNFTVDNAYFEITNNSVEDQTYSIALTYPLGSVHNPEKVIDGNTELDLFEVGDGYYYVWEADANGTFAFKVNANNRKQWKYEIVYGTGVILSGDKSNMITNQSFDVEKGDRVVIKFMQFTSIPSSSEISFDILFTAKEETTVPDAVNLTSVTEIQYVAMAAPNSFSISLEDNQSLFAMDLAQKYELYLNESNGCYYLYEGGPAVLVDFSSDTFVNLKKLVETEELYAEITAENGAITKETYNTLLQKYLDNAAVITVSQEKTATLYPLTEDLMYILKNVGKQFGWFDNTNEAYLFDEIAGVQQDSLWMFPCCTVQTAVATASDVTEEQPVTDPVKETVTEDTATE